MAKGTAKSYWSVTFDPNGNHMAYDPTWGRGLGHLFKPAETTFRSALYYDRYERGRSSVVVVFKDDQGHEQRMFFAQFMELIEYLHGGVLDGLWGYEKNGSNTGVYRIEG